MDPSGLSIFSWRDMLVHGSDLSMVHEKRARQLGCRARYRAQQRSLFRNCFQTSGASFNAGRTGSALVAYGRAESVRDELP